MNSLFWEHINRYEEYIINRRNYLVLEKEEYIGLKLSSKLRHPSWMWN